MSTPKPAIYLAGPVQDIPWEVAYEWRVPEGPVATIIEEWGGSTINPLEGQESKQDLAAVAGKAYRNIELSSGMLVNLLDSDTPSIGTLLEIGYAHSLGMPIVVVADESLEWWRHPMLTHATWNTQYALNAGASSMGILLNEVPMDPAYVVPYA